MSQIRVLLADDHAIFREGTRRILGEYPDIAVVGEAADGEEALRVAGQVQPDVAIVDIAMPRLNGIEVTRRLAAISPSTRSLILTAYDDDAYIFALLEAGAAGYLLKTVPGRELAEAVRAVHDGQTVLHPAITQKLVERLKASPHAAKEPQEPLTARELEILKLVSSGLSNKEVAAKTGLSVRTVEVHLTHIFNKLGVASRMEAVLHGLSRGWFPVEGIRQAGERT
ncbi:MAG: response regulator transcription factor [Chloroflexi bacterium]|nr:response regulator transcription factor [Chloroflexota bacterium]